MKMPRTYWIAGLLAALLAGCGDHPTAPPPAPSEPSWNVLATGETFIDVWGASPTAVFALGEAGSLFFYNGSSWTVLPDAPAHGRAIWGTSLENLFVVVEGDVYHYDGHAWEFEVATPRALEDIWGSSDHDIFVSGGAGIILHYDGSAWSQMPSGTGSDLRCLWGISSRDVFAAGSGGTVLHYDGSTWTSISTGTSLEFSSIWASSSSDIYCVVVVEWGTSSVLHYDGSSWRTVMEQNGDPAALRSVWGNSSRDVFVVGDRGAISHFDGISWSQMGSGSEIPYPAGSLSARAIWGSSSQDVFVVGGGYKSDDDFTQGSLLLHFDGAEWRPQASSIALPYLMSIDGVGGSSATDIYFVGGWTWGWEAPPVIQRFDGSAFGRYWAGYKNHFVDVWATADAVFAVGYGYNNACSDPSLTTVTEIPYSGTSVWALSRDNAFMVSGDNGGGVPSVIYHYDGSTWTPMTTGTTKELWDIWGSSETDVFAVGETGTILHYDGSSWSPMATETSNGLWGVWGSSSTDVYAVGDAGTIIHYDGTQWKAVPSMTQNRMTGVWGSSDRDVYVVGGIILHYDGKTWTRMGTTNSAQKVWGSGPGDVYVTGRDRILHYGVR